MTNAADNIALEDRLIFALDVETPDKAKEMAERLSGSVRFFKVGLELFLKGGFEMVDWLTDRGNKVFLDLKFYDVPATVARAVRQLNGRGIAYTTVHGDRQIMQAAAEASEGVGILAVTVLTSLDESDLKEMGFSGTPGDLAARRAKAAEACGCAGVICSGHEAGCIREGAGAGFRIVTPGIRPSGDRPPDDQKRVVTAAQAVSSGASHIVVGRPIRDAADPAAAADAIVKEMAGALNGD